MSTSADLDGVYAHRFAPADVAAKDAVWREVGAYLQRWIAPEARILDLACDAGYFIRHVAGSERWATDVRDVGGALGEGVRFVRADGLALGSVVPPSYFDVVFTSNYLEHLHSPDAVIDQLRECRKVIRDDGRLIVLQPNIRYVGAAYWDFIDHRVALTERSLVEAAAAAGFEVERLIVRFLPYTTKSRLPQSGWLVRAYLRVPLAWRILGQQTLLVARPVRRPASGPAT